MTEAVYLDYTREELDAQYTNVKNDADAATQKRLQTHSADVAERLATKRDLSYGENPSNRFDLYCADGAPGPVIVFTHGGQWQRGSTTSSCGWAEAALSHGISFVAGTFPMLPEVRLPDMVTHATALVRHVRANADTLGVDASRICIAGHSSGGHLAAATLVKLANENDLGGIVCGMTVSGNYDMRPLMLSYRQEFMQLDDAETTAMSPLLTLDKPMPPMQVAHGGAESDEFKRQASTWHAALAERGEAQLVSVPDANHFNVFLGLEDPNGPVWDFLTAHLGTTAAKAAE
ncbi:MAG: alpha/beta hydrolase [Alphaproteobacteria bacterium]|nr:alpha/beta hydrolase [Alphaproteobacteria bacterium]